MKKKTSQPAIKYQTIDVGFFNSGQASQRSTYIHEPLAGYCTLLPDTRTRTRTPHLHENLEFIHTLSRFASTQIDFTPSRTLFATRVFFSFFFFVFCRCYYAIN